MYNRNVKVYEDPWISINDHWEGSRRNNKMMYGEIGNTSPYHLTHMNAHGGLKVYILSSGSHEKCIVNGGIGSYVNGVYKLNTNPKPSPDCKAKLVRQILPGRKFYESNDNLSGYGVYGSPGTNESFSVFFEDYDFDTFIFATRDHKFFQAMKKDDIGGIFNGQYYSNQDRDFYMLEPGSFSWQHSSAKMYNRINAPEDPWISLNDHHLGNRKLNRMMYGERSFENGNHNFFMNEHEGLQVYVLSQGTFEECIFAGGIGSWNFGDYILNTEPEFSPPAECEVRLVRQTGTSQFHPATDNLAGTDVYGQEGADNTFSIQFDWMDAKTFILRDL